MSGADVRVAYRRTKPVFVWIAAIPILLLGASFWRRAHYRELIRMVDHTREVQVSIQDLLVSLTRCRDRPPWIRSDRRPELPGSVECSRRQILASYCPSPGGSDSGQSRSRAQRPRARGAGE